MKDVATLIKKVTYSHFLSDEVPLSSYALFQCGEHRFAYLDFFNVRNTKVISFTLHVTCFDKDNNYLGEFKFAYKPKDFLGHYYFHPEEPLVLPLDCEGFNYTIEDIVREERAETRGETKIEYIGEVPVTVSPRHPHEKVPVFVTVVLSLLILAGTIYSIWTFTSNFYPFYHDPAFDEPTNKEVGKTAEVKEENGRFTMSVVEGEEDYGTQR